MEDKNKISSSSDLSSIIENIGIGLRATGGVKEANISDQYSKVYQVIQTLQQSDHNYLKLNAVRIIQQLKSYSRYAFMNLFSFYF